MSYKNNALRMCRDEAASSCTAKGYVNDNVQVKTFKTGKHVMDGEGSYVEEVVPITTFTSKHKPGSYGALYKECKHYV